MPVGDVELRRPKRRLPQLLAIGLALAAHLGLVFALALKPSSQDLGLPYDFKPYARAEKTEEDSVPKHWIRPPILRAEERRMILRSIASRVPSPKIPQLIPVAAVILPPLESTLDLNLWEVPETQSAGASGSEVSSYPKKQ